MLLRRLAEFILSGRLRAAGVAFVATFLPIPGGSLGVLVASLVTLRKGAFEGSLVFAVAISASLAGYFLFKTPETAFLMSFATRAAFILSLLTWVFVLILRMSLSWSLVVEVSALTGILVILGLHWVFPDIYMWWVQQLTSYFHNLPSEIANFLPAGGSKQQGSILSSQMGALPDLQFKQWVESFSRYATGFLVASLLFNTLLQVLLARAWELMVFMPGKLRPELYRLRLGLCAALCTVLVFLFNYKGNQLASDMMPILVMVCALSGLSLVHVLFSKVDKGWIGLVFVYVGILMLFPLSVFGLAVPGLLDAGLNFRRKLAVEK